MGTVLAVAGNDDWRLQSGQGESLRGASFVYATWTPPPPEWVAVSREDDGRIGFISMRREPGPPGWREGEYPAWDHDHCELCSQRLTSNPAYEDGESVGWRTGDNWGSYRWVCARCFADFQGQLQLQVAGSDQPPA